MPPEKSPAPRFSAASWFARILPGLLLACIFGWPAPPLVAQSPPGTLLWCCPVPGIVSESAPAFAPDGTIYVGGSGLTAVTPAGAIKWTAPVSWAVVNSPTVAADGTIYCVDQNSILNAFAPDGSPKWTFQFPASQFSIGTAAIGADGTIYCVAGGILYALTPQGGLKWQVTVDAGYSIITPVIGLDGTIYATGAYGLTAVQPDGTVKWRFAAAGGFAEAPAIGLDGTIYFNADSLYAVHPDGTAVWASPPTNYNPGGAMVLGPNGAIYYVSAGQLYSVGPDGTRGFNGTIGLNPWHWDSRTVPVVDAAGTVYFYSSNSIFAVRQAGNVEWVFSGQFAPFRPFVIFTGVPAIGPDGTIYASFGEGFCALQGSGQPPAASGWPMYQQNLRHTGQREAPTMPPPRRRPDANFDVPILGELGQSYTLLTSPDFRQWHHLTNVVARTPTTMVADLAATNAPLRFYRVTSP